jgi:hypothetical protein
MPSEIEEPLLNGHNNGGAPAWQSDHTAVRDVEEVVDVRAEQLKEVEDTLFAPGFASHITPPVAHLLVSCNPYNAAVNVFALLK